MLGFGKTPECVYLLCDVTIFSVIDTLMPKGVLDVSFRLSNSLLVVALLIWSFLEPS